MAHMHPERMEICWCANPLLWPLETRCPPEDYGACMIAMGAAKVAFLALEAYTIHFVSPCDLLGKP